MNIKEGYFYHIKDEYFNIANDPALMKNKPGGHSRPMYLVKHDKESNILWFIPISSQFVKYENIKKSVEIKGLKCDGIVLQEAKHFRRVFLIQNMFPAAEKFVDHIHICNGAPEHLNPQFERIIYKKFSKLKSIYYRTGKYIYTDIKALESLMSKEAALEYIPISERIQNAHRKAKPLNQKIKRSKSKNKDLIKYV